MLDREGVDGQRLRPLSIEQSVDESTLAVADATRAN
jgi:hypothetical protein